MQIISIMKCCVWPLTEHLQGNSRCGNQKCLLDKSQVSLCNFSATCAVCNTFQEHVWVSAPSYFLFPVCAGAVVPLSWLWWDKDVGEEMAKKASGRESLLTWGFGKVIWTETVEVRILLTAEEHEYSCTGSKVGSIQLCLCQGAIASA